MTGVILSFLAAFCFAGATASVRQATQNIRASTVTIISIVTTGTLAMLTALIFFHEQVFAIQGTTFVWMAVVGVFQFVLGRLLMYIAIDKAGLVRAGPLVSTMPLFATFLALIFLNETITVPLFLGMFTVTTGAIFIVRGTNPRTGNSSIKPGQQFPVFGTLAALCAAISFAASNVVVRMVVTTEANSIVTLAFASMFGLVMLTVLYQNSLRNEHWTWNSGLVWSAIAGIFAFGALGTLFSALHYSPVLVVVPLSNVYPLPNLVIAHLFFKRLERITIPIIGGTALVIAGVTVITIATAVA